MKKLRFLLALSLAVVLIQPALGAVIGVDAVHGYDISSNFAVGDEFDAFRSTITGLGHTIVPLGNFEAQDLVGLDAIILRQPYSDNFHDFSPSEMSAIHSFVNGHAVFVSDCSMWKDTGADRDIGFGSNQLLLQNTISWISGGGGLLVAADCGSGFEDENLDELVSPYGISFANSGTEGSGYTVTGFVPHPVTAGLSSVGVDYQRRITAVSPAADLTIGSGADNVLAAAVVPEPSSFLVLGSGILALAGAIRRRRQRAE